MPREIRSQIFVNLNVSHDFRTKKLVLAIAQQRLMSAPLMVSISGIRGIAKESFTQEVIEKYTTAFGKIIADPTHPSRTIIVGRDSRMSGQWALEIALPTLTRLGYNILDIGIVPTPTVWLSDLCSRHNSHFLGTVYGHSQEIFGWNGHYVIAQSKGVERYDSLFEVAQPIHDVGLKFVGSDGLFLSPPKCKGTLILTMLPRSQL